MEELICSRCNYEFKDDDFWYPSDETPGDHGILCEDCFADVVDSMPCDQCRGLS
jgi:DNA-directed RNA polymerase subunit RPC12/RpoP